MFCMVRSKSSSSSNGRDERDEDFRNWTLGALLMKSPSPPPSLSLSLSHDEELVKDEPASSSLFRKGGGGGGWKEEGGKKDVPLTRTVYTVESYRGLSQCAKKETHTHTHTYTTTRMRCGGVGDGGGGSASALLSIFSNGALPNYPAAAAPTFRALLVAYVCVALSALVCVYFQTKGTQLWPKTPQHTQRRRRPPLLPTF